jgi:hypothetical protein
MSSNLTSFRLPSAYTIPTHIEHEGMKIPIPSQIRDNVRMLFNGVLDAHQAIVKLKAQVASAGGTVINNNTTNVTNQTTPVQAVGNATIITTDSVDLNVTSTGVNPGATTNRVYCVLFSLRDAVTVNKLSAYCTTGSGLGHMSAAIYSFDGSTKLVDAGTNAFSGASSQSLQTITLGSSVLLPGVTSYQYCWAVDTGGTLGSWWGKTGNAFWNAFINADTTVFGFAANSMVGGAMPATLGAITPFTHADGQQDILSIKIT